MYFRNTGNHLHEVGLIVNPDLPFLGATPDGIMCEKSTMAMFILCQRHVHLWSLRNKKWFFLQKNGDLFSLKHSHAHWYQIQGQLLIFGAPFVIILHTPSKTSMWNEFIPTGPLWVPWSENCPSSMYITLSHLWKIMELTELLNLLQFCKKFWMQIKLLYSYYNKFFVLKKRRHK